MVSPWCTNSVRVRLFAADLPSPPGKNPLQGLVEPPTCDSSPYVSTSFLVGPGSIRNGNLIVTVDANGLPTFTRWSDGVVLLAATSFSLESLDKLDVLGNRLYSGNVTFSRGPGGDEIYGLGEHKTGRLPYGEWEWHFEESQRRATFADNSDVSLPLYTSTNGYTFLWNLPSYGMISISQSSIFWSSNATPALDFWLSVADPSPTTATPPYASLSGQLISAIGAPSDLPVWATGFWQCKLRYRSQEELLEAARGYAVRHLPLAVIVIDYLHWPAFGEWKFIQSCWPDPSAMVAELQTLGVKVMVSVWPQVDPSSSRAPALLAGNYLIRNSSGEPWFDRATFTKPGYLIDATNPDARQYQWGAVDEGYYQHGIETFWLDAAEPQGSVPGNMTFWAGEDIQVGMAYPRENSRTFYEGLMAAGITDGLTLSRSAWIGSHALGGAVWSGDIYSNWTSLEQQIYIAQNMAMRCVGIVGRPLALSLALALALLTHTRTHTYQQPSAVFIFGLQILAGFMVGTSRTPLFKNLYSDGFSLGPSAPFFGCMGCANQVFPMTRVGGAGEEMKFGPLVLPQRPLFRPSFFSATSSRSIYWQATHGHKLLGYPCFVPCFTTLATRPVLMRLINFFSAMHPTSWHPFTSTALGLETCTFPHLLRGNTGSISMTPMCFSLGLVCG